MDMAKTELKSLDTRRSALEEEAQIITMQLTSPTGDDGTGTPMGIDTPLIDIDGYPRSDIDLFLTRSLRKRLAEIRTDHKRIMKEMERLLLTAGATTNEVQARLEKKPHPKFDPVTGKWVVKNWDGTISGAGGKDYGDGIRSFDSINDSGAVLAETRMSELSMQQQPQQQPTAAITTPTTSATTERDNTAVTFPSSSSVNIIPDSPFAKVHAVAPESPASHAGLQENDLILQFGSMISKQACLTNGEDPMVQVAKLVPLAAGEQQRIAIIVQRGGGDDLNSVGGDTADSNNAIPESKSVHALHLTPKPWNGPGLLGCHIVPV